MRFLLLLLAACTTVPAVSPARLAALKEVEEGSDMKRCKPLGRFVGNSALEGEQGMAQAREQARAKAAAAGATDVLTADEWQSPDAAGAAVKAYDCPPAR
jgi:hypothetical protein